MLQSLDTLIAFVTIMTICSVLVLIIVQMITAALSLRGKNLANALALTFQTISPELADKAHKLAHKILSDPLLSDSLMASKTKSEAAKGTRDKPWGFADLSGATDLATAIRPEEIYAALKKLSQMSGDADLKAEATTVLAAIEAVPPEDEAIKSKIQALADLAEKAVDPAAKAEIVKQIGEASKQTLQKIDGVREHLESWFNSAQDRSQQWFQMHVRGITIAVSVVFAVICQLDAVEVFEYVSTNAAVRDSLVKAGTETVKNGDLVADDKGGLVQRVVDAWNTAHADMPVALAAGDNNMTAVGNLVKAAIQKAKPAEMDTLLASFDALVDVQTKAYFQAQKNKVNDMKSMLSAAGFEIMPKGGWRWPVASGGCSNIWMVLSHGVGIGLFAGLLTLGAPYWFNMLKNLASLRSALSQQVEDDKKKAPAQKP